jgi:hypothetical protein
MVERGPLDDTEDFTVRELGRKARVARDQGDADYVGYQHDPEIWEVFRSIWPETGGRGNWRDDWSSVLLEV